MVIKYGIINSLDSVLDSHHRISVVGRWLLVAGLCPSISSGKLAYHHQEHHSRLRSILNNSRWHWVEVHTEEPGAESGETTIL
ncbi:hypothetical protein BYT27DRAFT_7180099 [Phlegmacium glaucopus]|nr:hypothetical protein BYT27DRAFT_7180099 [Phlegmacium glaucopus]